jgi:Na+-transporting NADH:ubiquinone oxidoreductase subunit NqrD
MSTSPSEKLPPRKRPPTKHKETLAHAIIELLKVRTLITLAIIGVMSVLAIKGDIEPATFMTVASAVVTYYFTRREEK